jgi:hypothetical protein
VTISEDPGGDCSERALDLARPVPHPRMAEAQWDQAGGRFEGDLEQSAAAVAAQPGAGSAREHRRHPASMARHPWPPHRTRPCNEGAAGRDWGARRVTDGVEPGPDVF